jgi:hypothetical protein
MEASHAKELKALGFFSMVFPMKNDAFHRKNMGQSCKLWENIARN